MQDQLASELALEASFDSLHAQYYRNFSTVIADSWAAREECFRIRYEVYCLERQFEDPMLHPDALERDAYDDQSVHALLFDRGSEMAIGTIRLVLHQPGSCFGSLPFHKICREPAAHDCSFLPFSAVGEVSRFAISKSRLQLLNNGIQDASASPYGAVRNYIGVGLLRMAIEMAVMNDVSYLCAIMEPTLLRMFGRYGIHFDNLGPLVSYHGLRQPCYAHVPTLLDGIEAERLDVWEIITDCGRIFPSGVANRDAREHFPELLIA